MKGVSGQTAVEGIDPQTFTTVWKPEIKKGPANVLDTLGPRDAVLVDDFAKSNDFGLGDKVSIETPAGKTLVLTVRGTVDNTGDVFSDVTTTDTTVQARLQPAR